MADRQPSAYKRTLTGFTPANEAAEAFWRETKVGQLIQLDGKRPRNLQRNSLYWVLCGIAADNMDEFASAKALHERTKIELGYYELLPPLKAGGKVAVRPGSTAFDKMSEAEFRDYFDKATALWAERLGVPVEALLAEGKVA